MHMRGKAVSLKVQEKQVLVIKYFVFGRCIIMFV